MLRTTTSFPSWEQEAKAAAIPLLDRFLARRGLQTSRRPLRARSPRSHRWDLLFLRRLQMSTRAVPDWPAEAARAETRATAAVVPVPHLGCLRPVVRARTSAKASVGKLVREMATARTTTGVR